MPPTPTLLENPHSGPRPYIDDRHRAAATIKRSGRPLARSLPDARDIAEELTSKGAALSLGVSIYDPTDPVGRLLFNVLGMVAEFEEMFSVSRATIYREIQRSAS